MWVSRLVIGLPALVLAVVACSGDDDSEGPFSGVVRVDGSSTVYPITAAMAEQFSAVEPEIRVDIGSSSTALGFEALCASETDITNASRPIGRDELDSCNARGIDDIVEVQVGVDALT